MFYKNHILEIDNTNQKVYILDLSEYIKKYPESFFLNDLKQIKETILLKNLDKLLIGQGENAKEHALSLLNKSIQNNHNKKHKLLPNEIFAAYLLILSEKKAYTRYVLNEDIFRFNPYENHEMLLSQMINLNLLENACCNKKIKGKWEMSNIVKYNLIEMWLSSISNNIMIYNNIKTMYNNNKQGI